MAFDGGTSRSCTAANVREHVCQLRIKATMRMSALASCSRCQVACRSTCIGRHPSGFMNSSKEGALSLLKTGLQLNHLANDKASGRQDATRLKASAGVLHPLFPLHGGVIQSVVPASEVEHTRVEHAMPYSTEEDHPSNRRINSPELSHRVARKLGSSLQATQV